jgi:UDP-galactose transporter B1
MSTGIAGHSNEIKLLIAIGGIYTCFITFAINTEGLYSYVSPDGEKFTATLFFLLVQCLTNTAVAGVAMLATPLPPAPSSSSSSSSVSVKTSSPPVIDYMTAGVSYICAMLFSTEALKYVSLPMQARGKSCKMVPVMLFGFLIRGKRYSGRETLAVLLITAGISVFQHRSSKPGEDEDVDVVGGEGNNYGLALLFLSLLLDGVTGACQDRMRESFSPSTHQVTHSLPHSLTDSLSPSLTHSLTTHSPIHSLPPSFPDDLCHRITQLNR